VHLTDPVELGRAFRKHYVRGLHRLSWLQIFERDIYTSDVYCPQHHIGAGRSPPVRGHQAWAIPGSSTKPYHPTALALSPRSLCAPRANLCRLPGTHIYSRRIGASVIAVHDLDIDRKLG